MGLFRPSEVYVYTGTKEYSGTGRSRVATDIVRLVTSYAAIPYLTGQTPKSGTEIVPNSKVNYFVPFWAEFRAYCDPYEVWIDGKFSDVLLQTMAGNRIVEVPIDMEPAPFCSSRQPGTRS